MDIELLNNTDNGKDNSEANFLSKMGGIRRPHRQHYL